MEAPHAGLTLALALAAGVLGQAVARHLRLPGIVILLALGWLLGPDALGWIEPQALGHGLFELVELAVAIILFEGGLNLEGSRLRRSQLAIRRLVTLGALISFIGGMAAAQYLLGWPPVQAALFGSLVVVTGPTVIGPLVSELRLQPRLATVLEAEGVLIDPVGAILAVLILGLALVPDPSSLATGGLGVLAQLAFGGAAGVVGGFALAGLLRVRKLIPDGFENIFALAFVLLLFVGSNTIVPTSGILAVPIAGVVVGNLKTRVERDLKEFKDQLTVMLIGLLFILLAADVRLADIRALGVGAVLTVAALIFVVRPVAVAVCTHGSNLTVSERAFLSWVAPRGIVAAAIASITASTLDARGIPGGAELRALIFLTIAITVTLAGVTALPVATLLGVRLPGRDRVGILGVHPLSLMLADQLRKRGVASVFLDSNPQNCRLAEEAEHVVIFGDGLQERTLQRARFESVGTAVGFTANDALNQQFANRTKEFFGVPRSLVKMRGEKAETVHYEKLFVIDHDVERWDVRSRHSNVGIDRWSYSGSPADEEEQRDLGWGERFIVLLIERGREAFVVSDAYLPKAGDVAVVAVYERERGEAEELLRKLGWQALSPEEPETESTSLESPQVVPAS